MTQSYSGGCLCGAVRFVATGEPGFPHDCSCRWCQRHTGSLSATWVEFDSADVAWVGSAGAPALYRSSETSSRAFCGQCGSSIGAVDDAPVVALLVGSFDTPGLPELRPTSHSFADGLPDWWSRQID